MELKGEHRIPAPRSMVWDALHDPDVLKECIRGCERLEKVDDRRMTATVQAKVGPVKATFDGNVEITESDAPVRYVLEGEGKGGVAGFAKGSAEQSRPACSIRQTRRCPMPRVRFATRAPRA